MAQILPFVRRRNVFDPDATLAMGDAYDKAIATIQTDAQSQFVVRELIAKRIIRMAQKGVIDRRQLCIGIIERGAETSRRRTVTNLLLTRVLSPAHSGF